MKIFAILSFTLIIFLIFSEKVFSQPEGRHLEVATYDEAAKTLYVYGGGYFKDNKWIEPNNLWIYHERKWTEVNNNINPDNRRAPGMAFFEKKLYLYGGARSVTPQRDTFLADLWRWNGKDWESVMNGPALETSNLANISGSLVLCGYPDSDHKDFEIWKFKKNKFTKVKYYKDINLDRGQGPLKVTTKDNNVVVANFQGDTLCIYSLGKKVNLTYCPAIPARTRFGLIWQPQHKKYYLFGGRNNTRDLNDLWEIDEAGNAQQITTPNMPEQRSAFSLLPTFEGTILYGGVLKGGKELSNELFTYDGSWKKLK